MKIRVKPKGIFESVKQKNLIRKLSKVHLELLKKSNYFKQKEYD